MQSPGEVKEQNISLKVEVTSIGSCLPPSPVPRSAVLHEDNESARALVSMLDIWSEETIFFCLHGGERSLKKKPGAEQLGFS